MKISFPLFDLPVEIIQHILIFIDDIFILFLVSHRMREIISDKSFTRDYFNTRLISLNLSPPTSFPRKEIYPSHNYCPHPEQAKADYSRLLDDQGDSVFQFICHEKNRLWGRQYTQEVIAFLDKYRRNLVIKGRKEELLNNPSFMSAWRMYFCNKRVDDNSGRRCYRKYYDRLSTYLPRLYHYIQIGEHDKIYALLDDNRISQREQSKLLLPIINNYLKLNYDGLYDDPDNPASYRPLTTEEIRIHQRYYIQLIKRLVRKGVTLRHKDIEYIVGLLLVEKYSEQQVASFLRLIHFNTCSLPAIIPSLLSRNYFLLLGSLLKTQCYSDKFICRIQESFFCNL